MDRKWEDTVIHPSNEETSRVYINLSKRLREQVSHMKFFIWQAYFFNSDFEKVHLCMKILIWAQIDLIYTSKKNCRLKIVIQNLLA